MRFSATVLLFIEFLGNAYVIGMFLPVNILHMIVLKAWLMYNGVFECAYDAS